MYTYTLSKYLKAKNIYRLPHVLKPASWIIRRTRSTLYISTWYIQNETNFKVSPWLVIMRWVLDMVYFISIYHTLVNLIFIVFIPILCHVCCWFISLVNLKNKANNTVISAEPEHAKSLRVYISRNLRKIKRKTDMDIRV